MAQSTDGSRGKIGFQHGRHAWEVRWEGPLGTVAVVGIATKDAAIQCHGYYALLGKLLRIFVACIRKSFIEKQKRVAKCFTIYC